MVSKVLYYFILIQISYYKGIFYPQFVRGHFAIDLILFQKQRFFTFSHLALNESKKTNFRVYFLSFSSNSTGNQGRMKMKVRQLQICMGTKHSKIILQCIWQFMARYTSTPALCGFWKIWNFLFELCLTFVRGIGKTNQKVLRVCEKQKTYHFCEVLLESENFRQFKTGLGLRRFFCVQRFARNITR